MPRSKTKVKNDSNTRAARLKRAVVDVRVALTKVRSLAQNVARASYADTISARVPFTRRKIAGKRWRMLCIADAQLESVHRLLAELPGINWRA